MSAKHTVNVPTRAAGRAPSLLTPGLLPLAVLTLTLLSGCGPPAEDSQTQQMLDEFVRTMTPHQVALANHRNGAQNGVFPLTRRHQMAGYLAVGDHASNWTGWLKGENPSVISESVSMGDYGSSWNTYYFANSLLTYYRSDQTILDLSDPQAPRRRLIMIEAGLTSRGVLIASRKLVDGEEFDLEPNEVDAILARADLLSDSLVVQFQRQN